MKKIWFAIAGVVAIMATLLLAGCGASSPSTVNLVSQSQGIWVTGEGKVTVTPDLAILSIGVQSQETTVADAQSKASDAMNKVLQALEGQGVADEDIQTSYFNISPVTSYDNDTQTQIITGYSVTNTVTVKVHSIDKNTDRTGNIIDAVVAAGGDLIRVNGITFTLEDVSQASANNDARTKAIDDAQATAQQMADKSGVKLGKITYMTENNNFQPVYRALDTFSAAGAVPAPTAASTSISSGELDITTTVQIAYAIE